MSKYTVFSPDHEVLGAAIITYRDSVNLEHYAEVYAEHELGGVKPDQWYPYQKVLDVLNTLAERGGEMMDFVSIGMAVSSKAPLPPEFDAMPFAQVIQAVGMAVAQFNRGKDCGYTKFEEISPTHIKLEIRDPAPDDLLYGNIYGYAKRFLPAGYRFSVRYDTDIPRRELGGHSTIIHVEWNAPDGTN